MTQAWSVQDSSSNWPTGNGQGSRETVRLFFFFQESQVCVCECLISAQRLTTAVSFSQLFKPEAAHLHRLQRAASSSRAGSSKHTELRLHWQCGRTPLDPSFTGHESVLSVLYSFLHCPSQDSRSQSYVVHVGDRTTVLAFHYCDKIPQRTNFKGQFGRKKGS